MILPIFFLLPLCIVGKDLKVARTGVRRISRLDVGMIFFVELVNEGKQQITVDTRMIGCCEILTIDDIECEHIQLMGQVASLKTGESRNLTLIWPTLYLHDRRGECEVVISCRSFDDIDEIRKTVSFDTTVSKKIPKILEGYYDRQNVRKCLSIDLDRLDFCRPINCQIKYNGRRNYFNRELQRCQSVPICTAHLQEELPNMIAAVLIVLIILFYCTMTIFMQVLPRKTMIEQSQQTRGSLYCNGSSKNFAHYSSTVSRKKFNPGSNITYSKLSNSSTQSVKTRSQ